MSIALSYDDTISRVRVSGVLPGLLDTFSRVEASGWGVSDSGAVWVIGQGDPSDYSVDGSVGVLSLGTVNVYRQASIPAPGGDVDFQATFTPGVLASGAQIICELVARRPDASNEYYGRVAFNTDNTVTLLVRKRVDNVVTTLGTITVPDLVHSATNDYTLRFSVIDSSIRTKVWITTAGEPDWQLEFTDTELTDAGDQAVRAVLASGNTNVLPVPVTVDDVTDRGAATVERSTDEIRWTTVRGGAEIVGATGDSYIVDDYEFTAGVPNFYRVRRPSVSEVDSITPTMDSIWIKNLARPFLNRKVTVIDWSDIVHAARNAVLPIIGRRSPIGLSDVRLAPTWELVLRAPTVAEANELVTTFASGEPVFVHLPGEDCPVPGGYAVIGDVSVSRGNNDRAPQRYLSLPMIVVAPPGPDVVGATMTWQTVINTYATWADVIAANATWQDLLDGIADPGDVVVG